MKIDMKTENPEVLAFALGLATVVFVAKGLLAAFWQGIPAIGCFWISVGVASGIGCGWAYIQVRKRKAKTTANQAPQDTARKLADPER